MSIAVFSEQHQGPINGLHFNPHKESSHLLASGGSDCEVYVTSIERPEQPNVFVPAPPPNNAKHSAEITKVAWNTQVAHILASASQNGSCFIWDLRQKRAWSHKNFSNARMNWTLILFFQICFLGVNYAILLEVVFQMLLGIQIKVYTWLLLVVRTKTLF